MVSRSKLFENATLFVIFLNAVWIMIDTDYNSKTFLYDADPVFQVVENCFCFYFTVELLIRYMSFMRTYYALRDKWFVFDFFLVLQMIIETWLLTLLRIVGTGGLADGMGDASMIRIARLLRLARLTRLTRLLRVMPELMFLCKGFGASMRSVVITQTLLLLVLYIFGIAFRQLTQDT